MTMATSQALASAHNVSRYLVEMLTKGPSPTKTSQVANMQNYIQGLLGESHHTFLQGSYRNDTATSDINDVDIVAIRLNTFSGVFSQVQVSERVYWDQIFSEIESRLTNQTKYNWTVKRDDKCVFVRGAFNADVVPAVMVGKDRDSDPMVIFSFKTSREKLNHPRIHYANGVLKSNATRGRYKPMVRMFKNWNCNHFPGDQVAISSFKMESLVHACDDALFVNDEVEAFIRVAAAILKNVNPQIISPVVLPSVCGYEDIATSWDIQSRSRFVLQLSQSLDSALNAYQSSSQAQADAYWKHAFNLQS